MKRFTFFLVPVIPLLVLVSVLLRPSGAAPAPTTPSSFPPCQVTLDVNGIGNEATATIVSGCIGPGFAFRSFVGQHTTTQFDEVTAAPWVVKLPPCLWQIDFSFMPGTPQHHFVAGMVGTGPCPPPTTTTTTTTTTVPQATTTTTCPTCTTSTVPVPPGTPLAPAPVPVVPIAPQQQQIQVAPGVTAGNG